MCTPSLYFYMHVVSTPRISLKPNDLQQETVEEPHNLICSLVLSSTIPTNSVYLTWNFVSNDSRVRVVPTTITTNDSIGIIYTTEIQFDYLTELDEGYYTCSGTFEVYSTESTFYLKTISKHKN